MLIADEPTGNLDSKTAESVFELFHELAAQGKTIIIVTHDSSLAKRTHRTALIADGEMANEYVARALPALDNEQLMRVSRAAVAQRYDPGALIFRQGSDCRDFYVLASGKVEIILQRENASDVVVAQLQPGQYFGEMQLLYGNGRSASARASEHAPAEVYTVNGETLAEILGESEILREAMTNTANERMAHNRAVLED